MNLDDYKKRAKGLRIRNTQPTMTDQSQARDCDINVIVKSMVRGEMIPARGKQPIYGDYSLIPPDLAAVIETAKNVERLRGSLPEAFKEMAMEDLVSLTPEAIKAILDPPANKADEKKDET